MKKGGNPAPLKGGKSKKQYKKKSSKRGGKKGSMKGSMKRRTMKKR